MSRRYAIIGGTGLIGTALAARLRERGDEVLILTRSRPRGPEQHQWSASRGLMNRAPLEGLHTVFNLTGAPIATRPWTQKRRRTLRDSRIDATATLLTDFAELNRPPKAWISAGGLGLFGDRGETVLHEDAEPGQGFLAELSRDWERVNLTAADVMDVRAAVLRMSLVLGREGGVFPLMLFPFRHGMGGWLGNGEQFTPWVSLRDAVSAFVFVADHPTLAGAFNLCVPHPPRNRAWCEALGEAVGRPVTTHAPEWALRGALGELASALFLASVRAEPTRLTKAGFTFEDPEAAEAFKRLIATD